MAAFGAQLTRRTPESIKNLAQWWQWRARAYEAPAPPPVKRSVLLRNGIPGSTWVESGTYLGSTTAFLARHFPRVITIEPAPGLYEMARERFADNGRIEVVGGASEDVMDLVLDRVEGDVSFWLDGHFSGGQTFEGAVTTPVLAELEAISAHLPRLGRVAVLIDDIRLFGSSRSEGAGYPPLEPLLEWAASEGLRWRVEYDILVADRGGLGEA